jgi:glycosyltransferase involved in cell wall biosynthesis
MNSSPLPTQKKILFIGAVNKDKPPTGGEEFKNQTLIRFLTPRVNLSIIDTYLWHRRPWVLLKILALILYNKNATIFLSASTVSSYRFLNLLSILGIKLDRVYYFVIGGYLPDFIKSSGRLYKASLYRKVKKIYIEGNTLKAKLHEYGITDNCEVLPNCKEIDSLYLQLHEETRKFRFVFISRITETKGISDIIRASSYIQKNRPELLFTIAFYGKAVQRQDQAMVDLIHNTDNCFYEGYLDILEKPQLAYETLADCNCLIFPTHWPGEGFPGVIIDAFICGLPVVASNWNMNTEIIDHQVTGYIVPPKDHIALAEAMIWCIENPQKMKEISRNCYREAYKYDTHAVLGKVMEDIYRTAEAFNHG